MPAPRGQYAPRGGMFAGRTFRSYFAYQQARSAALGFPNYSQERHQRSEPMFRVLESRAVASGMPRNRAISVVRQFMQAHPLSAAQRNSASEAARLRKSQAIKFAIDEGWVGGYDEDTDDWVDY